MSESKPKLRTVDVLRVQKQAVASLMFPIGVEKPGVPGIITAVVHSDTDQKGTTHRFFSEGRLSTPLRELALLELVSAEDAVLGIESLAAMASMQPEDERAEARDEANRRLRALYGYLPFTHEGSIVAHLAQRIQCELDALNRLIAALDEPYEDEVLPTDDEFQVQAEASVETLRRVAAKLALSEPDEDAVEAMMDGALKR